MRNNFFFLFCCFFFFLFFVGVVFADSSYGDRIVKDNYEVSRSFVDRTIVKGNIFNDAVEIKNNLGGALDVSFSLKGDVATLIEFDSPSLVVGPNNVSQWKFDIVAKKVGSYAGTLSLTGDVSEQLPISLNVTETSQDPLFLVDVGLLSNTFTLTQDVEVKIDLTRLKPVQSNNVSLEYFLKSSGNDSDPVFLGSDNLTLDSSVQLLRDFSFPEGTLPGFYTFFVRTNHSQGSLESSSLLEAKIAFLQRKLFGLVPFWLLFLIIGILLLGLLAFFLIRRHILSKRKYKMTLDMKTLPKEDKKFLRLGKIAEKKHGAFLDPHRLTTHAIVAGATGGGKSISAQVIIEEALMHDISVIVFDPTAQWSGMLRKCTDKKMFAYYPQFGMKPTDARGFPGNIRAVKDARQIVEIEKYFEPGHIQIFTLNKLKPEEMDIFVANVIRGIFESDPKEYPTLRTLLVFDEVHRLLPKFGGSGEGFVQIERACREFRKWGYGVMLVSQVLSDFMGEIKANISTEVQMRTRDEGDLGRIKTKFGDEFLQSLVKASVGVGMFVNPAYNHANPYFVQFRPILHNTRRLPDEELERYNQYNDVVDDLEYQIEQLEELKVDVFDLKMELKLVKDKIMIGNFSVVDIYLEGLKPRVAKQWEKLGKKPKKKEIKLASLEDIKKSVEEAKASHKEAEAKTAAAQKQAAAKKVDPMKELDGKIVNPLTLDNGMMISSLGELKTVLPNIDDDIWKIHVNEEKHDIATWFEQLSKNYAARMKSLKTKEEIIKAVKEFKGDAPATAAAAKPATPPAPTTPAKPAPQAVADKKVVTNNKPPAQTKNSTLPANNPQKLSSPLQPREKKVSSSPAKPTSAKSTQSSDPSKQAVVDKGEVKK